jgi:hypothetical protein
VCIFLPLYRVLLPDEDLSFAVVHTCARKYVVDLIVAGMMKDTPETTP